MTDTFESIKSKYGNSPTAIVLFVASLFMLVIGVNHFVEDTYSSYLGIKWLETAFTMNVQIFDWTYWSMSIAPQIASIVFFYVYLAGTDKKWALWTSLFSQGVDFFADIWYRSNENLFANPQVAFVSMAITFAYFTIGSELFITFGAGMVLKLFAPALAQWKVFRDNIRKAKQGQSGTHSTQNSPHLTGGFPGFPPHGLNTEFSKKLPKRKRDF